MLTPWMGITDDATAYVRNLSWIMTEDSMRFYFSDISRELLRNREEVLQ